MSEDDKKLHRAKLQVELEDAERDLAYLRDRAIGEASDMVAIASKIKRNATLEEGDADFNIDADLRNRLTPAEIANFKKADAIVMLLEELKQSRQRVAQLRQRKSALAGFA